MQVDLLVFSVILPVADTVRPLYSNYLIQIFPLQISPIQNHRTNEIHFTNDNIADGHRILYLRLGCTASGTYYHR